MTGAVTDNEIKLQGIEALISSLGEVQAERFISLILREPFDYTKWQKNSGKKRILKKSAVKRWLTLIKKT